jgi:hypothetical protein
VSGRLRGKAECPTSWVSAEAFVIYKKVVPPRHRGFLDGRLLLSRIEGAGLGVLLVVEISRSRH